MTSDPYTTPVAASGTTITRRVSWGAIFAGAIVVLAVQLLLALLGMSIGLALIDPTDPSGFGIGAGLWWLVSSLIALFAGGWVAGRLAGTPHREGMLHGLAVWALATLFSVFLVTNTVGAIASGAMNALSSSLSAVGQVVPAAAPVAREMVGQIGGGQGASVQQVLSEIESALTGPNADQARRDLRQIFTEAREQDLTSPAFRQEVVQFLVDRGGVEQARAETLADQAIQGYRSARENLEQFGSTAADVSEDAADAIAQAAFWTFLALLLGAAAGGFGGQKGAPEVYLRPTGHAVGAGR